MKRLAKEDVPELLQQWSRRYEVLCPGTAEQGDCLFGAFRRDSFTLDYRKPAMPPNNPFAGRRCSNTSPRLLVIQYT